MSGTDLGAPEAAGTAPPSDTIVAPASGPGRSSQAIVRMSGPGTRGALAQGGIVVKGRGCLEGRFRLGSHALRVRVLWFPGPASYTGEDSAEMIVPGNPVLVERVVQTLTEATGDGHTVRRAQPGEFSARAVVNDRLRLDQLEEIAGVIAAASEGELRAARAAVSNDARGSFLAWADEAAQLLALIEAEIDFADQEGVRAIEQAELEGRLAALRAGVAGYLGARSGVARATGRPLVLLAGPPNAGKSTLFNALLGRRRAVASPVAGTTRDVLVEAMELSRPGHAAITVDLADAAGMEREVTGASARQGQERLREAVRRADVVVLCAPAGTDWASLPEGIGARVIRVRTMIDAPGAGAREESGLVRVCALDGRGLVALRDAVMDAAWAVEAPTAAGLPGRHVAALREAAQALDAAIQVADGPREVLAAELRRSVEGFGVLTGRCDVEELLGRIFAAFCVGK